MSTSTPASRPGTAPPRSNSSRAAANRRTANRGAIVAALALVTAGFSGVPMFVAAADTATPAAREGRAVAVTIRMAEYRLDLPKRRFTPGAYAITVHNAGTRPHALVVSGPGNERSRTPVLDPGRSSRLDVTLRSGTHEFYCPVGNHRQQGMHVTVNVG